MVKGRMNKSIQYYYCEPCNMIYKDKKKAFECGEWCKKHKSCNLKIVKHPIQLKGGRK